MLLFIIRAATASSSAANDSTRAVRDLLSCFSRFFGTTFGVAVGDDAHLENPRILTFGKHVFVRFCVVGQAESQTKRLSVVFSFFSRNKSEIKTNWRKPAISLSGGAPIVPWAQCIKLFKSTKLLVTGPISGSRVPYGNAFLTRSHVPVTPCMPPPVQLPTTLYF